MQATNSGPRLSRRSGAGDSGLALQPSSSPQVSALPNRSLKQDRQRRATRPAQPPVQSSASRAWRYTVGSRLAPTLGLKSRKVAVMPVTALPFRLSSRSAARLGSPSCVSLCAHPSCAARLWLAQHNVRITAFRQYRRSAFKTRRSTLRPNHSLHPGPATTGVVSPVCASGSIVTHRAYNACLRGPGELER